MMSFFSCALIHKNLHFHELLAECCWVSHRFPVALQSCVHFVINVERATQASFCQTHATISMSQLDPHSNLWAVGGFSSGQQLQLIVLTLKWKHEGLVLCKRNFLLARFSTLKRNHISSPSARSTDNKSKRQKALHCWYSNAPEQRVPPLLLLLIKDWCQMWQRSMICLAARL